MSDRNSTCPREERGSEPWTFGMSFSPPNNKIWLPNISRSSDCLEFCPLFVGGRAISKRPRHEIPLAERAFVTLLYPRSVLYVLRAGKDRWVTTSKKTGVKEEYILSSSSCVEVLKQAEQYSTWIFCFDFSLSLCQDLEASPQRWNSRRIIRGNSSFLNVVTYSDIEMKILARARRSIDRAWKISSLLSFRRIIMCSLSAWLVALARGDEYVGTHTQRRNYHLLCKSWIDK